ncbi:MlaD family protein [Leptospira sp. GIMC2001]|uniref:MlaD family protein n=1 Tax=Leptospira sp. GIMC2001 TaxID=1513297 RepID=UPI00234BF587|nr:MCE family protein [Leptospira sp. GIMC2001]WCL49606.1 MlaD family protein [Leptospira sp. GIMC2001]
MKKELIAGLIFATLMSLSFFRTIISTEGKKNLFPYRTKIYYSQIDGIAEGTEVYIKGIESGFVLSIDVVPTMDVPDRRYIDSTKEKTIELTLAVKEPITLWDNYSVRFKTKTLFSGRIIDIDPGYFDDEALTFYNPIYKLDDRTPEFFPSARYMDNFFEAANTVITENREDTRQIVTNTREISEKLLGTSGTLPLLINTSIAYDELYDTLNDLSYLTTDARRYQEGNRKLESTHPIPFIISSSFFGNTTLTGRYVEPISAFRKYPNL